MYQLFAGPIFTEWYWTPLAFAVLIIQSAFIATLLAFGIQRLMKRSHKQFKFSYMVVGLTTLVLVVMLTGTYVSRTIERKNDLARNAQQIAEFEKQKESSKISFRQSMKEGCSQGVGTEGEIQETGVYEMLVKSNLQVGEEVFGLSIVRPASTNKGELQYTTYMCPGAEILMNGKAIEVDSIPDGSTITNYGHKSIFYSYLVEVK